MRLYVIRHGQTAWNKERRLQGRSDIELNENGCFLAQKTAEGMKDIPFDLAFTSPLVRAKKTAQLVLQGRDIPIIEDERIIEIGFGKLEGTHWEETGKEAENDPIYNFFHHPERYIPVEGGETLEELLRRTADFMTDICGRRELEDKTILVSAHGAAVRGILNSLRTFDMSDFWNAGVASNCGVAIIECTDKKPVLLKENVIYYENI